ncbi:unnamed protein product [Dovyalis caffra]|uniref:Protein NRT1/ PTR FAMILY 4.5-like n=1 Tax=Dovyalis caffra TaxID=77055 RepID=A0AAV1RUR5_9ROSI|nr:unnamed protein product [Dovyalis caffra]
MGDEEGSKEYHKSLCLAGKTAGKGGFRATMFVYGLVALDNMGFIAIMSSLVLYFMAVMQFDIPTSANTLTNLLGSTFMLALLGGFISDAYLNRLYTVLIFGFLEIVGLVLITIQAYSENMHPPACGKSSCVEGGIAFMLYFSLSLLALGAGGIRGALTSLGADQFNEKDPEEAKSLTSYFNWNALCAMLGSVVGVTAIVYVSMFHGWWKGFLVSTLASFLGFVVLASGKPFYRLRKPGDSPIIRIAKVVVVALRNRRFPLPKAEELYEIREKETNIGYEEKLEHTEQFRFLDKAAILPEGKQPAAPWTVCTVTQVEEVKILTRMLPILGSTIIMNTCLAQLQTFSVQQGNLMHRRIGKHDFPAASIPVIPLIFMVILIPIYEIFFVPFARKITGHPSGITQLQRVGVGLVLSAISMAVAGVVEVKRRNQALKDPRHPLSLFWLSFQYGIFGIADMFTLVGLLEFFYKEAPLSMKSLSTSFAWLSLSFGYFLSTVFVSLINVITKRVTPSKQGWLDGQLLDDNNLNLFYWFLAVLSCLNFVLYLYSASWYKYKSDDTERTNKPKAKALDDRLLLAKEECTTESCGAKTNEEESNEENVAKRNEEESTQEMVAINSTDAGAKAPSAIL